MKRTLRSGATQTSEGDDPLPGVRAADDLVLPDFAPPAANQLWVADIRYVSTAVGWLYVAAVVDCFSRCVVGWSMRDDLRAQLVVDVLEMAVARQRPQPGSSTIPIVRLRSVLLRCWLDSHSDRRVRWSVLAALRVA